MEDRNDIGLPRARRLFTLVLASFALMLALAPSASAGAARNSDAAGQVGPILDVLLLRPLGLVATATGSALFLVSAPIVAITRPTEIGLPFHALVIKPARYTWVDPIGDHAATD